LRNFLLDATQHQQAGSVPIRRNPNPNFGESGRHQQAAAEVLRNRFCWQTVANSTATQCSTAHTQDNVALVNDLSLRQ